ncbi:MAG TPA: sigma-70 family RNA polymerase sigma factor [Edaphocola sp.]|nr:sigma-70 family RNA polymerase sigma factor [Edaphocola sp.]
MAICISQQTDQVLVERFRNGDQTAAEELIARYQDNVYTTIYYLVKDRYIADDLFQDTFLKMLAHLQRNNYVEQGKFLPWILRIAHNLCIDYFRKAKQMVKVVLPDGSDLMELLGEESHCHEQTMVKTEVEQSVQQMITLLPDEQRTVVVLRTYGDLSFKEIAEMTGVSINTALGRMRYALKNMRRMIEEEKMILR